MKKLFLLSLLLGFLAGGAKAATVSGTLSFSGGPGNVAGRMVYLADSSYSPLGSVLIDSAITNSSGVYTFTISSLISSANFYVYSKVCGYRSSTTASTYSGSNLTINLALGCSTGVVSGVAYHSSGAYGAGQKIYIVDTDLASGSVLFKDSALTNSSGGFSFSIPSTISSGLIKLRTNSCSTWWTSSSYTYTGISLSIVFYTGCVSQAIYDTVKNSSTGAGVYGQKVYMLDSTATVYYKDSAYTNIYGVARFNVPVGIPSGSFTVSTYACGLQSQVFSYSGLTMTGPTLSVCTSNNTVSGTVTNVSTSAPVPSLPITLVDSLGGAIVYTDTTVTNSSGNYSFMIPAYLSGGKMITSTHACGSIVSNSAGYSGSSLTLNLSICSASSATISGLILDLATASPLAGRKVYLTDSSSTGGPITYRDSTLSTSTGSYSFTIPPSFISGIFNMRAVSCGGFLTGVHANYYGYSLSGYNISICSTTAPSATITGTLYNTGGSPATGAGVSITNSTGARASTTTNSSGAYTLPIPSTWAAQYILWADSSACGSHLGYVLYNGTSFTKNDTLCNYVLHGTVKLSGSSAGVSGAKVYLIAETYDTTIKPVDTLLTAYDSTFTNASGVYSFYNANNGYYYTRMRVKAMLLASDPNYANYLPSYADSALNWTNATICSGTAWTYGHSTNITLKAGTNPGGPGFIGGRVVLGANKNIGDPLEQRLILLTNAATGSPVAYAYSDALGNFSFPGLAFGTYSIFGDAWGKDNPQLSITLSSGNTTVSNVVFEENSKKFEGHIGGLSVPQTHGLQAVGIYPNPARDFVSVSGLASIKGEKTAILTDLAGRMLLKTALGDKNTDISTTSLAAGVYLLQIQTTDGTVSFRLIKE